MFYPCRCCSCDPKEFCKDFECRAEETEKGITIKITTKDSEKAKALKEMLKAHKTLCGDSCLC